MSVVERARALREARKNRYYQDLADDARRWERDHRRRIVKQLPCGHLECLENFVETGTMVCFVLTHGG